MDMHDVILQYQMQQEEVIKNMIRSHGFESVQDMKDKGYDIQKTERNVPEDEGIVTETTYTLCRLEKIDKVTFKMVGRIQ